MTTRHIRSGRVAAALIIATLLTTLTVSAALARPSDLQLARAASARFNSMQQAERAGYALLPEGAPLHECIASFDGTGAMGYHLINGALLDGTVDPTQPEVLVYAPDAHGKLKLVALEYVVFQADWVAAHGGDEMIPPPSLFGTSFMTTDAPNRYDIPAFFALHAWIWDSNPLGEFKPFNPDVSCP